MYKVIKQFFDKEDGNHFNAVGGIYPRTGYDPDEGRVKRLLDSSYIEVFDNKNDEKKKIDSMSAKELKKAAKEHGFMGAEQMTVSELRGVLKETLGL